MKLLKLIAHQKHSGQLCLILYSNFSKLLMDCIMQRTKLFRGSQDFPHVKVRDLVEICDPMLLPQRSYFRCTL